MKTCFKCKEMKEKLFFYKNKNIKDGYSVYCKSCTKILSQEKYKETIKKCARNCYIRNKKVYIQKTMEYRRGRDFGLYSVFYSMRSRCKYPSQQKYKYYGGKGVTVIWESYKDFKNDMYLTYLEHLVKYGKNNTSIDRIDSNGNYEKDNCRWATYKEQSDNKIKKYM